MNSKQLTGMSLGDLLIVGAMLAIIFGLFLYSGTRLSQDRSIVYFQPVDARREAFDVQVLDITLTVTHGWASTCTVVYDDGKDTKRVVYVPISR